MENFSFVTIDAKNISEIESYILFGRSLYNPEDKLIDNYFLKRKEMILKNPDFSYILAKKGEKTVGTMCVGINNQIKDNSDIPFGQVGFFEVIEDYEVFKAMLNYAKSLLKGCNTILFPFFKSTWHEYRLTIYQDFELFTDIPSLPYYFDFIEKYGYEDFEFYRSQYCDNFPAFLERAKKYYDFTLSRGFSYRCLNKKNIDEEICALYKIAVKVFKNNKFYSPISIDEFKAIYEKSLKSLEENLITIAENKEGEIVGFIFSFPDFTPLFKKYDPSKFFGKAGIMIEKNSLKGIIIKTTAVDTEKPTRGVYGGLLYANVKWAYDNGFNYLVGAYFHKDHVHNKGLPPHPWKNTYHLYKISNKEK